MASAAAAPNPVTAGPGGVPLMAPPVAAPVLDQSQATQHDHDDFEDDAEYDDQDQEHEEYYYADDSDAAADPNPDQASAPTPATTNGSGLQMVTALSSASDQWRRELARERLVRSGWLEKRGDKQRSRWKRRWFVLRGGQLAFYKDEQEYSPMGIINTADIHSVTAIAMSNKHEHVMAIVTRKKTLYLDAAARVELEAWLMAFDDVVRSLPPSAPSVLSLTDLSAVQAASAAAAAAAANGSSPPPHQILPDAPLAVSPTSVQAIIDPAQVPLPSSPAHHPRSYSTGDHNTQRRLSGPPLLLVATRQNSDPTGLAAQSTPTRPPPRPPRGHYWDPHDTSDSPTHDVPVADGYGGGVCARRPVLVYKDEREYTPLRVIALQNVLDVLSAPMGKGLEKRIGSHPPANSAEGGGGGVGEHHPDAPPVASDVSVVMGHEATTCFHVVAAGKTYQFASESRADMCHWVRELRRLVAPFQMGVSAAPPMVPPQPLGQGQAQAQLGARGRPVSAPADVLVAGAAAAGVPVSSDEASDG
ncbi:hypothetical protein BCR44DRAFT_1460377 [Catenaria anguillulae PL171]|uniref:PH domain-containing protein n=1 Tax=Catenaria anguillulae PL171 TaxID=765915 RepID=A0A1Y2HQ58_9FUNG|nr:hypothetical protein BCR44DRAFT_1460377 [Catenaria anguillulae PL171]